MKNIEIKKASPEFTNGLSKFFELIQDTKEFFYPHPLDCVEAERICNYSGNDLYYLIIFDCKIIGYGLLRGWDANYSIPSLGIAISPEFRGQGWGRTFMLFLHSVAKTKGCKNIILKVNKKNNSAINLYKSLGYILTESDEFLSGICSL